MDELSTLENDLWQRLSKGSHSLEAAFNTGTLGTVSGTGHVSLRTVVLRNVQVAQKVLTCYSDRRAGKIRELQENPAVSWLFWDEQSHIQLRLTGKAVLLTDGAEFAAHWQKSSPNNRKNYLTMDAPGSVQPAATSGLPDGLDTHQPTPEESERGRENFAVIHAQIQFVDWVQLSRDGNRRAYFRYEGGRLQRAEWAVP